MKTKPKVSLHQNARSQAHAWERTVFEAPPLACLVGSSRRQAEPAIHWVPRQSLGTSLWCSENRGTKRSAFTLIELLLVLAILGVIMSMVIPNLLGRQKYANIDATRGSVKGAEQAVRMYALDHLGEYPSVSDGFRVLVEAPRGNDTRWRGPYLTSLPQDAWGNDLVYQFPSKHPPCEFDVYSCGPDKSPNTSDDIGNWLDKREK